MVCRPAVGNTGSILEGCWCRACLLVDVTLRPYRPNWSPVSFTTPSHLSWSFEVSSWSWHFKCDFGIVMFKSREWAYHVCVFSLLNAAVAIVSVLKCNLCCIRSTKHVLLPLRSANNALYVTIITIICWHPIAVLMCLEGKWYNKSFAVVLLEHKVGNLSGD